MAKKKQINGDATKMTREEAGRLGGVATLQKYGPGFFEKIGGKGGKTVSKNRAHMAEIGRRGGEARNRTKG